MNRLQLEEPFAPQGIKQRKGCNHKMMDYVEGHTVIQRLNDIFDAEWEFTVMVIIIVAAPPCNIPLLIWGAIF